MQQYGAAMVGIKLISTDLLRQIPDYNNETASIQSPHTDIAMNFGLMFSLSGNFAMLFWESAAFYVTPNNMCLCVFMYFMSCILLRCKWPFGPFAFNKLID